jgi:hypothetical protein
VKTTTGRTHPSTTKSCMEMEAEKPMDDEMSILFNFLNVRFNTLLLMFACFLRFGLFDGVVDSRETRPSKGISSQSSSDVTSCITQREMEYQRMQDELRRTSEVLVRTKQDSKAKDDYLATYNA